MDLINEQFVREVDSKLIAQDVKLHQRPFQVAIAWMREKKISGEIFDKRLWDPLMELYRRLYPSGDFSMPSMLVGGVALRDQMYLARVHLGFGQFTVEPLKCIEIPPPELDLIFRYYPEQGWRAFYSVCDLWDFAYGVDDLSKPDSPAYSLLGNARSSIAATARILAGDIDVDAAVQTACLSAELASKAVLTQLGWTDAQIKRLSHHLTNLADALIAAAPAPTDDRLRIACANFPDYVGTRYASHGMTRVQLMELAMRAQFVAADAIRRISKRNMGGDMEARANTPTRVQP